MQGLTGVMVKMDVGPHFLYKYGVLCPYESTNTNISPKTAFQRDIFWDWNVHRELPHVPPLVIIQIQTCFHPESGKEESITTGRGASWSYVRGGGV